MDTQRSTIMRLLCRIAWDESHKALLLEEVLVQDVSALAGIEECAGRLELQTSASFLIIGKS
eukprot:5208695-Amphidinium_carterae.1